VNGEKYGVREWRKLSVRRFLLFFLVLGLRPGTNGGGTSFTTPDHRQVEVEFSCAPDSPKGRTELHRSVAGFTDAYGIIRGCFLCLF